jgi:murein L,D-transpeptidase YafK
MWKPPGACSGEEVNSMKLWIFKAQRELWLIQKGKVKKVYRISLGKNPIGHKQRIGDNCTPEGEYFISEKKENSRFHRFLALSYPNIEDADLALENRRITTKHWADIWFALQTGKTPPPNTPLGGRVGIHGQGVLNPRTRKVLREIDWTEGCIALTDAEIEELFQLTSLKTPVKIWR